MLPTVFFYIFLIELLLLISIWVYLLFKRVSTHILRQRYISHDSELVGLIYGHIALLKAGKIPNAESRQALVVMLNNKHNISVFHYNMMIHSKDVLNEFLFLQYVHSFKKTLINDLTNSVLNGDSYQRSYALHLLSIYFFESETLRRPIIKLTRSTSLYLRLNALIYISKMGETPFFIQALQNVNKYYFSLNPALIKKIIDNFRGDIDQLNIALKELLLKNPQKNIKNAILAHLGEA